MRCKEQSTEKLLPDYPLGYKPNTIEIHDEKGLLIKIDRGKITTASTRPKGYTAKFICWYIDGKKQENIAYVHTNLSVLVNRISQIDTNNIKMGKAKILYCFTPSLVSFAAINPYHTLRIREA